MKLSVVIPCYNEKDTVREIVGRVLAEPTPKEVILVDDGSTDGTRRILKDELEGRIDQVIYHERNMGKGAAVRTGFAAATGEFVIVQDADLEYNPAEYPKIIAPLVEGRADAVFGSRFVTGEQRRVLYFWHYVGNRFLTVLSNMFTNINLTDMETCYKAFRTEVVRGIELHERGYGFEPEITAKVAKKRLRIYEVGISYQGRTYAEGKKIGWRDGFWAIWCIVKYNLLDG